jgi:hypothetical protein
MKKSFLAQLMRQHEPCKVRVGQWHVLLSGFLLMGEQSNQDDDRDGNAKQI